MPKYPTIPLAQTMVRLCEHFEIDRIVICAGSRNAPLTNGFVSQVFFKTYSIVDERAAGFFALGMAQQLKKPVVLVCTSGSALLNFYPARLQNRYKIDQLPATEVELIEAIGARRGCVKSGGHIDFHKASTILINEIRDKTLGEITFETPNMIDEENIHFAKAEADKLAAREAKKLARGRGRKNKR